MFNSCTISDFFWAHEEGGMGWICIKAGAFGVQLARPGFGVET